MSIFKKVMNFVLKAQPTSSGVHVNAPLGDSNKKREAEDKDISIALVQHALKEEMCKQTYYGDSPEDVELDEAEDAYDVGDMQRLVEGLDWEISQNQLPEETALEAAEENIKNDPNYYRAQWAKANGTDSQLDKADVKLDLGSGPCRHPGFIGLDLYPHDSGTVVHDVGLGIPADDASVSAMRLVNSLSYMDGVDRAKLFSEIVRSLQEGGTLHYEGPEQLKDLPPELELKSMDNNEHDSDKPWYKQVYKRVIPDAATSNDAYPRLSPDDYAPMSQIVDGNAIGYYYSDATSAAATNRAYGYPSQGAQMYSKAEHDPGNMDELEQSLMNFLEEERAEKSQDKRVATVAVLHKGKILMGKRRDNGKWTFPGGHAEPGEDMHKAALRELEEETGIKAKKLEPMSDLMDVSKDQDGSLQVQCYKLELPEMPSTSMMDDPDGEVYRWHWYDWDAGIPDHVAQNLHVPEDQNVLMQAMKVHKHIVNEEGKWTLYSQDKSKRLGTYDTKEQALARERQVEHFKKDDLTTEGREHVAEHNFAMPKERKYPIHDISHARNALARVAQHGSEEEQKKVRAAVYRKYPRLKPEEASKSAKISVAKIDKAKQLVYGVVLTPDEVDTQDDYMNAADIEKAAHFYLENSRTVGSGHEKPIKAVVVESYISPVEFKMDGPYGPQTVMKGAWVLCVKVLDKKEWQKVVDGEYQGFSVGGFGTRT